MSDNNVDDCKKNLRKYITRQVRSGFHRPSEVIDSAIAVYCDDANKDELREISTYATNSAYQELLIEQQSWPEITDCDRLDCAFRELNDNGIIARQDFSCCPPCGVAEMKYEIDDEINDNRKVRGYTFYHMQDTEAAVEGYGITLCYGATVSGEEAALAIGKEIVNTLNKYDLKVEWNGQWDTRINVNLDWKRRIQPLSTPEKQRSNYRSS